MKLDKSKSQFLKFNATSETLKKQNSVQRQASKKYSQFKKSASQPAYFLNKSRLKKISDIYRAMSLQKLAKNNSLHKSKSLYNSITPQKKNTSYYNNHSFKKPPCLNTINLNRALQSNEKTKRLKLNNRASQNVSSTNMNNSVELIGINGTKFLLKQIERLQQISNMTMQKAFIGQYDHFFKSIRDDNLFGRVGTLNQMKYLISKFCSLVYTCQQRIKRISQKQIKSRYDKIQIDFSSTNTQLKKKTFKMELLIKQINQIKDHNIKLSKQLADLKQKNKTINIISNQFIPHNYFNDRTLPKMNYTDTGSKKRISTLRINNIFQLKIHEGQAQIKIPPQHQLTLLQKSKKQNNSESQASDSAINYFYKKQQYFNDHNASSQQQHNYPNNVKKQNISNQQHNYTCSNNIANKPNQQGAAKNPSGQKIQMIKHIRTLQKKQKQLVKTLIILKSDGIDVERAFNEAVISGQQNIEQQNEEQALNLTQNNKMPSYIKKINNKDLYDADSSIIDSIDGLTVRYFEGEQDEEYITYPIKHQYKSKPLNGQMRNKLKLDFNALYQDEEEFEEYQNKDEGTQQVNNPPTY